MERTMKVVTGYSLTPAKKSFSLFRSIQTFVFRATGERISKNGLKLVMSASALFISLCTSSVILIGASLILTALALVQVRGEQKGGK